MVCTTRRLRENPSEMIHIDIKKLGRFSQVGHRITGDPQKGKLLAALYREARGIEWVHQGTHLEPNFMSGRRLLKKPVRASVRVQVLTVVRRTAVLRCEAPRASYRVVKLRARAANLHDHSSIYRRGLLAPSQARGRCVREL
ncbi:hypothetical protein FJ958_05530 [Mesorhizobium sp. B2-3-5]|nr:hypothetical protein FJ958_05530 [Mesorhizobium sp. B2-3-5]